jgi:hypothetical protein
MRINITTLAEYAECHSEYIFMLSVVNKSIMLSARINFKMLSIIINRCDDTQQNNIKHKMLSIMTLSISIRKCQNHHYSTQHNKKKMRINIMTLAAYAECHSEYIFMLSVINKSIMLSVTINFRMLSIIVNRCDDTQQNDIKHKMLSIMTLIRMALSIKTQRIMTLSIILRECDTRHNNT